MARTWRLQKMINNWLIMIFQMVYRISAYFSGEKQSLCCLVSPCVPHGPEKTEEMRKKTIEKPIKETGHKKITKQLNVPAVKYY